MFLDFAAMKTIRRILFVAAAFALAPLAASAQGLEVLKQNVYGSDARPSQVVYADAKLFQTAIDRAINENRNDIANDIKRELGKGDRVARGVTLYNMTLHLGKATVRFVSNDRFEATIPGNHFYARATTPSVFGSYADPAIEINFDVMLSGRLVMPTRTNPTLSAADAIVSVPRLTVKGRNITGNVGVAILSFAKTVAKREFQQAVDKHLQRDVTNQVNARLRSANNVIRPLFTQNYAEVTARIDAARQMLQITMTHRASLIPPGPIVRPTGPGPVLR